LIKDFEKLGIPYLILVNKCDTKKNVHEDLNNAIYTSIIDEQITYKFKQALINLLPEDFINTPKIAGDLVPEKSTVILVTPIDKEAPKGRLILPQVQTIRDLLDSDCLVYTVKETELKQALDNLKTPPSLVITDSQAFRQVSEIVPEEIPLTSFSILFARLKGDINAFAEGAKAIDNLKDGDMVLILESCTHHAIEDDIGRVKIPNLLRKRTGKNLVIHNFAGHDFPDIKDYKLIIHCGACMTNRREVLSRIIKANNAGIPITNYGIAISYCLGILPRAIKPISNTKI
jgi:[FeFe] hydrogenase H-cluster maturation GTPase HydF